MLVSGRLVLNHEDYYGFSAQPSFMVGYATLEEGAEVPCATSGWMVGGYLCLYLYQKQTWDYIWVPVGEISGIDGILDDFCSRLEEVEVCLDEEDEDLGEDWDDEDIIIDLTDEEEEYYE